MHVVLASDQNLIRYVATLVRSVVMHNADVTVHLLLRGCDPPELPVRFVAYDMNKILPEFPFRRVPPHLTFSAIDRLMIPEIIPANRVLYLDVDTVVLGNVSELYRAEAGEKGIVARPSIHPAYRTVAGTLRTWGYGYRVPPEWPSFNSGVLVMDCDRLRSLDFTAGCIELIRRHGLNDQAALGCWCQGKFERAQPRWNVYVSQGADQVRDWKILHWVGPKKPWHPGTPLRACWTKFHIEQ